MQYMLASKMKDNVSPNEWSAITKKFQSWQVPEGLKVEGNWYTGPAGFTLVSADDYGSVLEAVAQFSEVLSFEVYPVIPAEQAPARILRGLEWATK